MVKGLLYDHSEWGNLAKNTKKKYRDLLKINDLSDRIGECSEGINRLKSLMNGQEKEN